MAIQLPGKSSDFLKFGVAAAARGDLQSVREILRLRPKWMSHVGSHGRTMLWEASHRGRLEVVKYLVRRKADINACGTHYTPYFVEVSCYCIARYKKHDDVADFLQAKGAEYNVHSAAFLGDLQAVRTFLRKRSRVNEGHPQYVMKSAASKSGTVFQREAAPWATPLVYALRGGTMEVIDYLIQRGAKIKGNERALFIAAQNDVKKVRLLLENGADTQMAPEVHPDEGELFQVITEFGGNVASSAETSEDLIYLCRGDRGGNPDEVRRLIKLGADVNHHDSKGKTALHRAAKAGFTEVIEILLQSGARVDIADSKGETALFDVLLSTIKDVQAQRTAIRILLEAGASTEHENQKGQTPRTVADSGKHPRQRKLSRLLR